MKELPSLRTLERRVAGMDPKLKKADRVGFQVAVILLACAHGVKRQLGVLQGFTGYPRVEIREALFNLQRGGVLRKDGALVHSGWNDKDPELAALGFWLDVCIGRGWIQRSTRKRA